MLNTTKQATPMKVLIQSGQLDKTEGMASFLKQLKLLKELTKGVSALKTCVYPSLLQKQAMPALKKTSASAAKNVIIRYRELNGIKLTVLLPVLHNQIRHAILEQAKRATDGGSESEDQLVCSLVLCHSQMRAAQMTEFTTELTQFCSEIVEAVNVDELTREQLVAKLKEINESKAVQQPAEAAPAEGEAEADSAPVAFKKSVVLIGTPGNFVKHMLSAKGPLAVSVHSVILDKIDLLQAMEFKDELVQIGDSIRGSFAGKAIFTTNAQEEKDLSLDEQTDNAEIKTAFFGKDKALIVKMNDTDQDREMTSFETAAHLFTFCKTQLDKYIVVFNLIKLAILEGKTVIMVKDVTQAYRMKYFLAKFSLRSFVISTDMPKAQVSSILHFFNIGQFDLLIMLHTGYAKRPLIKDITNIINFDMAPDYNSYKQMGLTIVEDTGCILSLPSPDHDEEIAVLGLLTRKLRKAFGRDDMLKCLPVIWPELSRSKSRVESVFNHLSNRAVQQQKVLEFKKQLVSNRALKEYFKQNPEEKEILNNDIRKAHMRNDRFLFRSLDVMPSYVIPKEMIAITPEQIAMCGIGNAMPCLNAFGNMAGLHLSQNLAKNGIRTTFVEPEHPATIVQNMVGFPAAVERYNNQTTGVFAHENPETMDYNALEPTAGRKLWKMRHGKSVKKRPKKEKSGFRGAAAE